MRNTRRRVVVVVLLLLAICELRTYEVKAGAQDSPVQQNQSVVAAARRTREQKKTAALPARIWTNDDFKTQHTKQAQENLNKLAPITPHPESSEASARRVPEAPDRFADTITNAPGMKDIESEEDAAEDAEIARLKKQLSSAQNTLDWRRRQFLLQQNTIYSNPAYTTTHVGKSELDSAQLQIDQIQQEVDSLKGPLANLEWRRWRRMRMATADTESAEENNGSVPPSALVLPKL
jgi:hypothetical protein